MPPATPAVVITPQHPAMLPKACAQKEERPMLGWQARHEVCCRDAAVCACRARCVHARGRAWYACRFHDLRQHGALPCVRLFYAVTRCHDVAHAARVCVASRV